jgi:GT2 family glycosyltransferase/glycosyltransferase involved in cell wall biosynthesis
MTARIRTLLPMAADGVGPSHACLQLVDGIDLVGVPVDLLVNRRRTPALSQNIHAILPGPLSKLPHKIMAGPASHALEAWYLARLREDDVAWLWPNVSERTHDAIARRGNPIVLEGINSRMAVARDILDVAYDALGAPAGHNITDGRIAEEEHKLACATTIFAPSPCVEDALAGSILDTRFLPTSYGTEAQNLPAKRTQDGSDGVTFLFCGYACVRKGIHHLLDVWPQMPQDAKLRIVGRIEPLIAERYANVLNAPNVQTVGFTRDLDAQFSTCDVFVFPSLEEGDPLVTYKAAAHGLPIIASRPGAGRIGADTGCATIIPPTQRDDLLHSLQSHHASAELRAERGAAARAQITQYDWHAVGARRGAMLAQSFPQVALQNPSRSLNLDTVIDTNKSPHATTSQVSTTKKTEPDGDLLLYAKANLMTQTSTPRVSIILPAYNRAKVIVASVESVLRQTFEDFELIIVDDGSTDGTVDVVRQITDSRVHVLALPENIGVSGARNRGIAAARADWVAFQDSDDEWLPEKLSLQMERLTEPDSAWIGSYCGMVIIGGDTLSDGKKNMSGRRTHVSYLPSPTIKKVEGDIRPSLMHTNLISTQMLIARRDALALVEGFDENLAALVDWDLVLRLSDHGPFAFVDEPLVLQRFSDNSITRDQSRRTIAREQLMAKHHDRMTLHPDIYAQQLRVLAGEQRRVGNLQAARATMTRAVKLKPLRLDLWTRLLYLRLSSLRG